jgi:hypothetical protein
MRIEQLDLDEWDDTLPDSGFEVFHTPQALTVLDEYTDAEMRLYGVFKGQEPVGMLPVFVESARVGRTVTSPPPSMLVPRLGPLFMPSSPKQRKRESVNRKFVNLVLQELDVDSSRSLLRFECPIEYDDPRPFQWSDLNVDQSFTYVLDLTMSAEEIRGGFSSVLRQEIKQGEDTDFTVSVESPEAADSVYEDVAERYREQGESIPASGGFVRDVVETLDERSRVYVARDETGEYLSGIIVLYSNNLASFWQGGARASYDGISVNPLLHWTIITDIISGDAPDVSGYDLVGANTPHLCEFKAKFGGDLIPYYTVESAGIQMSLAKRAYSIVSK